MEETGVIESYAALLNREKIGLGVMAFVNITLERHGVASAQAFREAIGNCSTTFCECWSVSGEADYLLRVVAEDLKTFSDFLLYELQAMPFVATVRSNITLGADEGDDGIAVTIASRPGIAADYAVLPRGRIADHIQEFAAGPASSRKAPSMGGHHVTPDL